MRCSSSLRHLATVILLALPALAWPLAGHAGLAQAVDMGCYNCHGDHRRGDAPSFEQIAKKYAGHKGDAAAEQKLIDQWRQGEWLQHIDAHERVSPETAQALLHWLVEGAK
jgi:cytochrome c551/c552